MIGPFFYINSKALCYKGFLYHAIPINKGEKNGEFLDNRLGHAELFDEKFKNKFIEYFDFPRGRVVYNPEAKDHNIYIDKCIENKAPEIAKLFEAENYKIDYDGHYVCKKCISKSDLFR